MWWEEVGLAWGEKSEFWGRADLVVWDEVDLVKWTRWTCGARTPLLVLS